MDGEIKEFEPIEWQEAEKQGLTVPIRKIGLNDLEIAQKLGISQQRVAQIRKGALLKMRKYIEKNGLI